MKSVQNMSEFEQNVLAAASAARAESAEHGLDEGRSCAAQAAMQAVSNPGVLVRVGCLSLLQWREQANFVSVALFGFLQDPRQLFNWISRIYPLSGEERSREMAEGITFELHNGSGVRVHVDAELAAEQRSGGGGAGRASALAGRL